MQKITELQPYLSEHFAKLIATDHLAHAYLLRGAAGTGKLALAQWIAAGIFCSHAVRGKPCLKCSECHRIMSHEHPDVIEIIPEEQTIKVEQIRYLKTEFIKSGLEGQHKIFIIDNAEKMTLSAANSLLKFIEEPGPGITIFLLSAHSNQILPTIISRCEVIDLTPLTKKHKLAVFKEAQVDPLLIPLLLNLNGELIKLIALGKDEHFQKMVAEVWNWMKSILTNNERAFIFVQTRLLPLIRDNHDQEQLLQLIVLITRDLLLLKYNQDDQLSFITYKKELVKYSSQISTKYLTVGVEMVLKSWNQLSFNVVYQNVIESLTLKLMECYHES